jgi:predicted RND superfamily exporter protein
MKKISLVLFVILLLGCTSTRAVQPLESAKGYRELSGELHQQQTDIAITGQKIEDQSRGFVENLTKLETAMANTPEAGEAERLYWLSEVKAARAEAEVHQADIENLNRHLSAEREMIKKQDQKFNEYELALTGELSIRDTENAQLREDVKTVKGQRNTFLGIFITAAVIVLLFAVFKVLRFFKILPF